MHLLVHSACTMESVRLPHGAMADTGDGHLLETQQRMRVILEALIIRIGCWGPLYFNYNQEPPEIV